MPFRAKSSGFSDLGQRDQPGQPMASGQGCRPPQHWIQMKRFTLSVVHGFVFTTMALVGALALAAAPSAVPAAQSGWAKGIESQRKADLGNGMYLNPVLSGDRPDPSVLKDGADYYMTHSSFFSYPGLLIWHSRDLVNWRPIAPALKKNVGSVWAPELVKHKNRYYIYFPGLKAGGKVTNFVVYADRISGPWSDPIDLKIVGQIDPGHVVDADGKRFLFVDGGQMIQLADDGLSTVGALKKVYGGWKYPSDWAVESFSLEGPKLARHGDYYYLVSAEGGTAGPPTSHMVIAARARSLEGPWENSPYNPIVHTVSKDEKWWSRGHGTLVEGPDHKWYLMYHAYENGFYTLGRQTLLEPVEWTTDGWFKSTGIDVAGPIPKPGNDVVNHGIAWSDDFSKNKMGLQWAFHEGTDADAARVRYENGALVVQGKGESPADSAPLAFPAGDQAYQVEVEVEIDENAKAGLLVFYNEKLYAGLGLDRNGLVFHRYGQDRASRSASPSRKLHLRLVNDRNVIRLYTSADGQQWSRYRSTLEVSGYHHNVAGGFISLRPAIYAAGQGQVKFRNFRYLALP
jgi:beta-xylosidase